MYDHGTFSIDAIAVHRGIPTSASKCARSFFGPSRPAKRVNDRICTPTLQRNWSQSLSRRRLNGIPFRSSIHVVIEAHQCSSRGYIRWRPGATPSGSGSSVQLGSRMGWSTARMAPGVVRRGRRGARAVACASEGCLSPAPSGRGQLPPGVRGRHELEGHFAVAVQFVFEVGDLLQPVPDAPLRSERMDGPPARRNSGVRAAAR